MPEQMDDFATECYRQADELLKQLDEERDLP
jgi:hypothetical protein